MKKKYDKLLQLHLNCWGDCESFDLDTEEKQLYVYVSTEY